MTAKNRAGLITKLHTSLKKHYKPAPAAPGRPLLEHILYAALLEDAPVDLADEGFAKCEQEFFDWNEVRVTSVTELAEVLSKFPSPATTSMRLKRCLQSVFEAFYNFDIDHLKKENLGKAVSKFEAMNGVSPFVLAYLVQHGLGGHAIPVNSAAMHIMFKAGIVSESEAQSGKVPGLERAIPKSKAIEFSSMLHQAAVALQADPKDKTVWDVILAVNKDAVASEPQAQSNRKPAKPGSAKAAAEVQPAAKPGGKAKAGDAEKEAAAGKTAGKGTGAVKAATGSKAADAAKGSGSAAKKTDKAKGPAAKTSAKSAESKSSPSAASSSAADQTKLPPGKSAPGATAATKKSSPAAAAPAREASPAKKSTTKAPKKVDSASPSVKPAAGKGGAKKPPTTPAKKSAGGSVKKSDTKKTDAAPAAASSGNQKLTKRKPR